MNAHDPTKVEVNLSNCDREPIHIPGAVQPHGALLAYGVDALRLCCWSSNVDDVLGGSLVGGESIDASFSAATVERLKHIVAGQPGIVHPLRVALKTFDGKRTIDAAAHVWQGVLIVELEIEAPSEGAASDVVLSLPLRVNLANQRMNSAADAQTLFAVIADEVRRISGYDRVMVYQFLEGGHGAVVGEAKAPQLESFLGLHYPATDIPEPARRLYTLNMVRSIADIHARSVPLRGTSPAPLDLSLSVFRAVSPIHIEYLSNMGVAASMSVSILRDGQLWGLIACHHYAPRVLSLEQRAVCETLGTMAGAYVTLREQESANEQLARARKALSDVFHSIAVRPVAGEALALAAPALMRVVEADGIVLAWDDAPAAFGLTPALADIPSLLARAANSAEGMWVSSSIAADIPELSSVVQEACGCLAMSANAPELAGIMFFRREYAHEVRWAGEPVKIEQETPEGLRLSPRRSFAEWKEAVRNRARPWSRNDLTLAEDVRVAILETLGRRAAEVNRVNIELKRLNADLDSFAYAASHDLREPLRGLNQVAYLLDQELSAESRSAVQPRLDAIRRLTGRMDELVGGLLRLSRAGSGDLARGEVDLVEVTKEAAELVFGQPLRSDIDLVVEQGVRFMGDYLCVRELLSNLLQNGAKYNRSARKQLRVGADMTRASNAAGQAAPAFYVRDNGIGIAPERRSEVFEIFRRLHLPEEFGGGSGAGLTIAKKIAERHGGRIWIESTPDAGTTVFFTLQESNRRQIEGESDGSDAGEHSDH